MGNELRMRFPRWEKTESLKDRVEQVVKVYGQYPILVTTPQSYFFELVYCIKDLIKGKVPFVIFSEKKGYSVARAPTESYCNISYRDTIGRFVHSPCEDTWVCEINYMGDNGHTQSVIDILKQEKRNDLEALAKRLGMVVKK